LCPFCKSKKTRKYGKFRGKQRYKCNGCKKTFQNIKKPQRLNRKTFTEYCLGKQTLTQLGVKLSCSLPTIQKHLDEFVLPNFTVEPREIILVIDALYFGTKKDKDGLLISKDWLTGRIVYRAFIQSETKLVYQIARNTLEQSGFKLLAVVVDGRPGIRSVFADLPLQMCQFHLIQIVNRYITKNPKLIPTLQLKTILDDLTTTTEYAFKLRFHYWLEVNQDFLNEKTINPDTGRYIYKHKRLRSAVRSIQASLPFLFTYQTNENQLSIELQSIFLKFKSKLGTKSNQFNKIPNTTNCLDGWFAHLRKLLLCHNGLRKDRRNRVIEFILATQNFN
jgi:hypothetical protein